MPRITGHLVYASLAPSVTFDDDGVEFAPLWAKAIRIGWDEVQSVCVTPTMKSGGPAGWEEAPNMFRHEPSIFQRSGVFVLKIIVRDRRSILARTDGWLKRLWLAGRLRPMFGSDDRPLPDKSVLSLTLRRDRLDGMFDQLLDLLTERSRFELVVDF